MEPSRAPIRLLTRPAAAQNPLGPAQAAEQEAMYQQLLQQQQIEEEEQEAKLQERNEPRAEHESLDQQQLQPPSSQQEQEQHQPEQQYQQPQQPSLLMQTTLQDADSPQESEESQVAEGAEGEAPTATSALLSMEDSGVDAMVLDALTNGRDRVTVIKFDQQCCHFLKERRKLRLEFPNLSSYHRLLIHRIADYYMLAHNVEGVQPTVVLTRTEHSRPPTVRLCDLVEKEDELLPQPQQVTMIMKRTLQKTSPRLTAFSKVDGSFPKEEVLIQQRELEYEKARAMIFDERRSSPPEMPNRKTVELLDQIMPSSRDPDAVDKKRMMEPGESHLYNRRLYAPTFPHYQPHWYPEPRMRDCWQPPFQRPPPVRLRGDNDMVNNNNGINMNNPMNNHNNNNINLSNNNFILDTSSDSFPPLGKELDPECLLVPGPDGELVTSLLAGTPSWSPPWAFPSPLLTSAETAANASTQQNEQLADITESSQSPRQNSHSPSPPASAPTSPPQASSPSPESVCSLPAFASSFSSPLHSPVHASPSTSAPSSPASLTAGLPNELSQLSLFSDSAVSQSFPSPLSNETNNASTSLQSSSSSSASSSNSSKSLSPQKLPRASARVTTLPMASTSVVGGGVGVVGVTSSVTNTTPATNAVNAAALRAKKKATSLPRAVPPRPSPRTYPPGSAPPALLSTASFQSFAPAPFGSTPGTYYPSPAHRQHNPSPSRHQPNSSLSPSNHSFYPPNSSSFYSLPPQHQQQPKPTFPFPLTAASWTSEILPAKPRGSTAVGGAKPQSAPQLNKKGPKAAGKGEVTMHVTKSNTFVPRVQTDDDPSFNQASFTPRRPPAAEDWNKFYPQEGQQAGFPQSATFAPGSGQNYGQEGPYQQRPTPGFNPSPTFNAAAGYTASSPYSPSQPYPPPSFAPQTGRFTKSQSPSQASQQYGSSFQSQQQQSNFSQPGVYTSSASHAYPPFNPQQQDNYPPYSPYQNGTQQQFPQADFPPSNFAYKQPQHPQHSPAQESNFPSNTYQSDGYEPETTEQQPPPQQQYQQYPMYPPETGYPAFSQGGW